MQIIENVFRIPDVACNTYLIVEPDGLTIIDAGLPGSTPKTLAFIASLGKTPSDLKRILITHSDWDHIGSLRPLKKATGARTYASQLEAEAMAAGRASRPIKLSSSTPLIRRIVRFLFRPPRFQVDELLKDGQVLPILGGLQVLDTPGHCPGHISLFAASEGILFCGDSMVTEGDRILGSRPIYTWDADIAQASVKKQASLGARIVCSGHGPVITDAAGKFPV